MEQMRCQKKREHLKGPKKEGKLANQKTQRETDPRRATLKRSKKKTLQGNRLVAGEERDIANRALRREREDLQRQSVDHLGRVRIARVTDEHERVRNTARQLHEITEREEVACNIVKVGLEAVTEQIRDEAACT